MHPEFVEQLLVWYGSKAKPFIEKHRPERVHELEADRGRIERSSERAKEDLTVCFLGNSGIGKSTLINALLDSPSQIVPAGGIGPLTAQAITVAYGENRALDVSYHGARPVNQVIFGLRQSFRDELGDIPLPPEEDGAPPVDVAAEDAIEKEIDGASRNSAKDTLLGQARLMIKGDQAAEVDLRYVIDRLQQAIGQTPSFGTALDEDDTRRMWELQYAIAWAKRKGTFHSEVAGGDLDQFQQRVKVHASGHLAPLINKLAVRWDAPILKQGITLVDLPGVGIVSDAHREVTREYIRSKAKAVVLVVDHRGMTESVLDALQKSEFLNARLYAGADQPVLIVAVTRVDDAAEAEFLAQPKPRPKNKREIFADVCSRAESTIRTTIRRALENTWLSGEDVTDERRELASSLLQNLRVHPVSAPQFLKLLAEDEDDRPFLTEASQSGIPALQQSLVQSAQLRRENELERLDQLSRGFLDSVRAIISVLESNWEQELGVDEQLERLREEISVFFQPLREQLARRQGEYRNYLRETIPETIQTCVQESQAVASKEIRKYLRKLGDAHWSTLCASVRRSGRYSGARDIDLPSEFALRFEAPMAETWSGRILKNIRRKTTDYANACEQIVETAAEHIREHGNKVPSRALEAQRNAIAADAQRLKAVGRESIEEVREEARVKLIEEVEKPIRKACEDFVRRELHKGRGVKDRILELYNQLADTVTEVAAKPANRLLTKLYREAEAEIVEALADHHDPLNSLLDAVIKSEKSRYEKREVELRTNWIESARQVLQSAPNVGSEQASAAGN